MAYCTVEEAEAAGATGDAPTITAAITEAGERIDLFTGDHFETTGGLSVVAAFGADGSAPLPRKVQSVTSVTFVGASTALPVSSYRVRKSDTPGDIDAIELVSGALDSAVGYDLLVAGAEPWNGGFANLGRPGHRVTVVGTFGWAAVPANVRRACQLLAAAIANQPEADEYAAVERLSVEGYTVVFDRDADPADSTGLVEADRLLVRLRRQALVA